MKKATKNIFALAFVLCSCIFCSCGGNTETNSTIVGSDGGAIEDAFITEDNFD